MVVERLIQEVMRDLDPPERYAGLFRPVVEELAQQYEPVFSGKSEKYRYYYQKPEFVFGLIRDTLTGLMSPLVARLPRDHTPSAFSSTLSYYAEEYTEWVRTNATVARNSVTGIADAKWCNGGFLPLLSLVHRLYVPLSFEERFSHAHIIGSTGSGKTTLLQNFIADDLETDAAVVVIDPHKQLTPALERLKLERETIVIDPTDAPGINIFDVKHTDDPVERERVFANVVKMFTYLFREGETPPTGKQMMVFQYLCRLVLSRVESHGTATLMDLFEFLVDPTKFADDIARLPMLARSFFADFSPKNAEYKNTGGELRYRLHTILSNPTLEKMFTAPKTEIDIGKAMDDGALVLIDADQSYLGDMHAVFGKIFLAQIMEAARMRDPSKQNRPVYVYVDEAHRFLDEQVNDLLTDARKYRVGCMLAHQHLGQIQSSLVKGALQGTAIKIAGGVRAEDANALAADMRTTKERLLGLPKYQFAAYVHNSTPNAVSFRSDPNPLARFEVAAPREKKTRVAAAMASTAPAEVDSDQW